MRWIDWLWMTRGKVRLAEGATDEVVLDRAAWLLEARARKTVTRREHSLRFRDENGPLAPNWWPLTGFERGRVWIDRSGSEPQLRYELRRLHLLIFCLVAFCACVRLFAALGAPGLGLRYGLIGFAWIFGVNLVLSTFGDPPLFVRAVDPRFPLKLA